MTTLTIITLPKPALDGPVSLEKTIASRRSHREFLPQDLSIEQISQLLWAAQGQDPFTGYRTAPSAGATYPLETFTVSRSGYYRYHPQEHNIEQLSPSDLRPGLAVAAYGQKFIETGPLTIVFAGHFARISRRYGQRSVRYVFMEAGHAAQNIHLQAQAMGLGSVAVGAFEDTIVADVLMLPDYLDPVYLIVAGYCRE